MMPYRYIHRPRVDANAVAKATLVLWLAALILWFGLA